MKRIKIKDGCKRRWRSSPALAAAVLSVLLLVLTATPASAERFQYDPAGRLTRVIYDDLSSITYEYDPNGNVLSVTTTAAGSPGDADLDGDVDDADVAAIVTIILGGGQPYSPTADCNADERVSVLDVACTVTAKGTP
ncbi:MAG: RHS repeat domain-containing protein [Thermoanaerobaculia bacterium]